MQYSLAGRQEYYEAKDTGQAKKNDKKAEIVSTGLVLLHPICGRLFNTLSRHGGDQKRYINRCSTQHAMYSLAWLVADSQHS
jgi:hypothetical protein